MRFLPDLITQYHAQFQKDVTQEHGITAEIQSVQRALLDGKFHPSIQLSQLFDKLLRRSKYPMEVAIVGQFSSGKSTFLNALLSKDILPTGITPVTSKVNFINYAKEYKLKVSYKNGAHEYHSLDHIAKFTDQRESIEDVKYLTLYAPNEMLKDISFVDTPGLNSLSHSDTEITKKILRDVDGIIWLTLIDNAGKESESAILKEYLANFKSKSLCVLNQKDKFEQAQIDITMAYMQKNFSEFFAQIVPISAKQALDSRVNEKEVRLQTALRELQEEFKQASSANMNALDLEFFTQEFQHYTQAVKAIKNRDQSDDMQIMKESNISEVLSFIEKRLRPQAIEAKKFSIRKDLDSVCEIIIKEYETISGVYSALEEIILTKEDETIQAFDAVYLKHSKELFFMHEKIDEILNSIAQSIFKNIKVSKNIRFDKSKSLLGIKITEVEYESLRVDHDNIMQELFYLDEQVPKQVKSALRYFSNIERQSSEDFRDVFRILKHAIQAWQEPYEQIKKHREIASDEEFANTRQFVSKVYENVILDYHRATLANISALEKQSSYLSAVLGFSTKQSVEKNIFSIESNMAKQVKLFEREPLKYSIFKPSIQTIKEALKKDFSFEEIETLLTSRQNYLYKIVERAQEQFREINLQQVEYVRGKKLKISKKIEQITIIKKQIIH